jgi:hypothetical protein
MWKVAAGKRAMQQHLNLGQGHFLDRQIKLAEVEEIHNNNMKPAEILFGYYSIWGKR